MNTFNVYYGIITDESSENGDFHEIGLVDENVSLREGIKLLASESQHNDSYDVQFSDFVITVSYGRDFLSGLFENRYLHIPRSTTTSSLNRIHNLFK
jgi:hypothetical protein